MSAQAGSEAAARPRASGAARALALTYTIFAIAAGSRSIFQIATKLDEAPLAYLLSAIAAVVYVVAAYGFLKATPASLRLAHAALLFELVGVLVVGTLTVLDAGDFPDETVWSIYGQGYGFVPLVLPVIGLLWMRRERRRRA